MRITKKIMQGLKGLTEWTDSDIHTGQKLRENYVSALADVLERFQCSDKDRLVLDCYNCNGQFMQTVTFDRADVYAYIYEHMLDSNDSIQDLQTALAMEIN